jgi:cytochrome c oxidase subunit IV
MTALDPRAPVVSHQDPKHHVTSFATYFSIFFALMILTGVTVGVAFVDLGILNTPIAMLIASLKAVLVILWFMHVLHSTRLTWVVVVGSFVWLALLFILTFTDYWTRHWLTYGPS